MRRAWKILGVVVAAIALAFGALVLYVRSAESRRWNEMGKLVEELAQEAGRREGARPVLRGEPVPGDAWEEYVPFLREYNDALKSAMVADRDLLDLHQNLIGGALAVLRRGVRRASARNPHAEAWARGEDPFPKAFWLPGIAGIRESKKERQAGRLRPAAELALDAALYARDVGFNVNFAVQEQSKGLLEQSFEELRQVLLACGADREVPRQIAAELEILDRILTRSGYVVLNELTRQAGEIHRGTHWRIWDRDIGPAGWRHGFSRKLMAAEGFARMVDWIRRHLDGDDLPWGATRNGPREEFIWTEMIASPNGFLSEASHADLLWQSELRHVHAQLHLLRVAAHYLATGAVIELPDPYLKVLRTSLDGPKLRAWSIGRLRDNVGVGGFEELTIEVTR